jgi:CHAT domain-containing protein
MVPPGWRSRTLRFQVVTLFSLSCLCSLLGSAAAAKQSEDARELVANAPIERELRAGGTHVYKVTLAAETYLRVSITAHDIELQSKLSGPDSSNDIGVVSFPAEHGLRVVSLVAGSPGSYRLEIRQAETAAKSGRYAVKIEDLHPATDQDKLRVAAERAESAAGILLYSSTAGQRQQGISKYEEALALWRSLGEHKREIRLLTALSTRYRSNGEVKTALEYHKQAIQMARTVGDRYQEANLMNGIGAIYMGLGENQNALDSYNLARQLSKNLSARYSEALAIHGIGLTLIELGEWQSALSYLAEALTTFSYLDDRNGESNTLNAIGHMHRILGNKQKGIESHERALAIARTSNSVDKEALSLGHLGNAYLELGDKHKALDLYEQSLKQCKVLGKLNCEGSSLKRIGDVAFLLGDTQRALESLKQAVDLYRSNRERASEAKALHSLAQVNYSLGHFDEARKQIESAVEIQESLRAKVISQQSREAIFTSAQGSFALYIDLLMQLHKRNPAAGHDRAALQASERARARSLLELLFESQADIREGVPKELLALERSLRQHVNAKAAARTTLLSDKRTQAQAALLDKEIAELTARYREVEVQIRQSSPRYAALTQPQPLTSTEIQHQLDDNTVMLEFALGEKQSWLWAVTRSSINSYKLPSGNEIESSARKVYELLTARQPRKGETEEKYQARIKQADGKFQIESANLSEVLLGQIADKLQREWKGKRLAIVALGALEYIPFAALPIPQRLETRNPESAISNPQSPQPLITEHEVVNLPSATALGAIRRETARDKRWEKTVAVLADPVFEVTDSRLLNATRNSANKNLEAGARSAGEFQRSAPVGESAASTQETDLERSLKSFALISERGGFSRLPFSREEADAISALAPKNSSMKATDFRANRSTATSGELSHYRIIHFATHGLLNSERPELSGLVLSLVDENGRAQDGFLLMHEIYNLNLPADVVVLSACQTALGKQIRGEGLVGLTRGFMYAGAQRVVASLWNVDDLATAQLMKRFYRGMLKEGLRPAAALRAAQLETLKQKRWSSPFFWAAFTIQGEWK